MLVVDSSVWINYFNGEETQETQRSISNLAAKQIIIGDLILAEVLQGFRHDRDMRQALAVFGPLLFEPIAGRDIALASVRNYRRLRARGITVKAIDMLIATFCLENGHHLLHSDRDFDPIEKYLNLKVLKGSLH